MQNIYKLLNLFLKVRSLDVIVPRPSTNINAKRISITGIYFAFFLGGGIEMTD
jgi:hypothetical protein